MSLAKTAVERPVFTSMLFTAMILFGLIAYQLLPKDLLPQIEIPTLTVVTVYPGAGAPEVENQVTRPLEEVLAGVNNLKNIYSQSKENVSFITLQFDWNTNLDEASGSVRDYLEFASRNLPPEANSPVVMRISSEMFPILIYGINAKESFADLGNIIDRQIGNALKRAPGVGSLVILGKPQNEVKIHVNPNTLKNYKLSIELISQAIQTSNVNIPAGSIKPGLDELSVAVPIEFSQLEDIKQTVVSGGPFGVIRLGDIAEVSIGLKEPAETARVNGQPAVGIFVQKQAGTNVMEVTQAVRAEVEKIKPFLPEDVSIEELMDNAEIVEATINNLFTTIVYAAIFVMLVVFIFLRKVRSSIIIILTIPVSLIVAFIFMYLANFTINIFSLMSLAIAIGMVIDNAIVVLENITKHIERGVPPMQAAIFGTREMSMAIFAATMTTIAVFIPLIFMGGVVGIMFRELAVLTAITLLVSLFSALMLTPMLSAYILKPENKEKRKNIVFQWSESAFENLESTYLRFLQYALWHKTTIIISAVVIFVISLWLTRFIGTDYIPEFDAGDLSAVVETRVGASTEETLKITKMVEDIFREEVPEIRQLYSLTGQSEGGLLSSVGFKEGRNVTSVFARMVLPEQRDRDADHIANIIRKRIAEIPEVENFSVSGGSLLSAAVLGNIRPIQVKISGDDLDSLNSVAQQVMDKFNESGLYSNIESTIDKGKPEVQIITDKTKASALGVNPAAMAMQIRQSIYGMNAGSLSQGQNNIPINIRYHPMFRTQEKDLQNILITSMMGQQLRVSQLAQIQWGDSPEEIKRENQERVVYIMADPLNVSLGEAAQNAREIMQLLSMPENTQWTMAGQVAEQEESFTILATMFLIGFILVFMVMASQFESLKNPFIIIFTVPFSLTGIILAFWISGLTLSVVTFLGVIMLLGIVVNNGIVLVDYTNLLRKRGYTINEALPEAGRSRLRPVLMTTFTTLLAMIPMALSRTVGSEMWSPLAVTMIGGLLFSSLITLVLVPVVYRLMNKETTIL